MRVVSLALPLPLFREFSYSVPAPWEDTIRVGSLVEVEFQKRRMMGLVRAFEEGSTRDLKPINRIIPVTPWTTEQITFVERLSQLYFAPLGEVAGLFFPPPLHSQWQFLEKRVFLVQDLPEWGDFPTQGVNLFLLRETSRLTPGSLGKLLRKGIFRTMDERYSPRSTIFGEKIFRFWRVALKEERLRWLRELIEKSGEEKKILLIFPDFQSLDACEAFLQRDFPQIKAIKYDSRLNAKKRMVVYRMVEERQYELIMGTRLALFLPALDIYHHVLFDPEERGHYSELSPHYHALQVLYEKVHIYGGALEVVGIIPPLWIYHRLRLGEFQEGNFEEMRCTRAKKVKTVALETKGGKFILSPSAREIIARTVSLGERVLVWVQKTGYASALGCRECGFYYLCPDCEVALRYHADLRSLLCPLCGKKVKPDDVCPVCGGHFWEGWGEAIEMVYGEFQKYFPRHCLLRVDSETPLKELPPDGGHPSGIVVGTSAMLKEEILRKSALLILLSFENWLYLSEMNARDEFYNEFHRALFFLGIDAKGTPQVVIQGSPEAVTKVGQFLKPWQEFYRESLQRREALGYPPFRYLVRVIGESRNKSRCIRVLNTLQCIAKEREIEVTGPLPGVGSRKRGKWTEELILRFEERRLKEVFTLVSQWMVSVEKEGIRWNFEVER
jgi:primosomal protein N' (replication factor Y)